MDCLDFHSTYTSSILIYQNKDTDVYTENIGID
jgi:hypothetical protein